MLNSILTREEWRAVPSLPDYEVSSEGRVRRRPLRVFIADRGYAQVVLRQRGARITAMVHRLVLEAFHGAAPSPEHVGNHKNGIKTDNRPENLEWATQGENVLHAYASGLNVPRRGARHHRAVLTDEQAERIRDVYRSGNVTLTGLAKLFGVSRDTVGRVVRGKTYAGAAQGEER